MSDPPEYRLDVIALDDPYPFYRRLRDEDPAHYSRAEDLWVLTRYEDCHAAFNDWRTWSSFGRGNLINDLPDRIGKTLGTSDPPRHTFARGLVNRAFTPRTVARLEPTVRKLARELAMAAAERGTIEFASEISAPFNAGILGAMFGLPEAEFLRLRRWLDDFFLRDKPEPGRESRQAVAMRELHGYLDALAAERIDHPTDDLMSAMIDAEQDGQKLDQEQVVVTTMTFLTAGFESTNNCFTNLTYALALHPELLDVVRQRPDRISDFVEEGIRWDAPAQGFVRSPTSDVELHGKTIPAGAQVVLHIGAANRDERRFRAPDRFELDRDDRHHVGFGQGVHFCVGAPLARTMAQVIFEELLDVSSRWEVDLVDAQRVTTPNFRGFARLPLTIR